jgi:NAD+ kinase
MRAVGLVPNRDRPVAHELARRATRWLLERNIEVRIPLAEANAAGLTEHGVEERDFVAGLDLVVSLGGDGTMLHTATLVFPADVPILGINAGNLGYLNAFEASDLEAALSMVRDDAHSISSRVVLQCTVESAGAAAGEWHGLNEVVLEKISAGRMVRLAVAINDEPFTSYAADGVVVATPTGSTAYSFSLRGPIVSPTANVLLLTPISPHMLFDRSLVLGGDETIDFTVTADRPVAINIDGRPIGELATGDRVRCTAASQRIAIVAAPDIAFHQILKAKFELPDR